MNVTLKTDQTPWKVIPLETCTVSFYEFWVWTQFPDGSGYGGYPDYTQEGWPHFTDDYRAVATLTGYDDPLRYCLEHDFFHSWVAWRILERPSSVLWALAHNEPPPLITAHEEALTILAQSYYNGGRMFATSPRVDWASIMKDAKRLLN